MISASKARPSIPGNASSGSSARTVHIIRIARSRDTSWEGTDGEPGTCVIAAFQIVRRRAEYVAAQNIAYSAAGVCRACASSRCPVRRNQRQHANSVTTDRGWRTRHRRDPAPHQQPVSKSDRPRRCSRCKCKQQPKQQRYNHFAQSLRVSTRAARKSASLPPPKDLGPADKAIQPSQFQQAR